MCFSVFILFRGRSRLSFLTIAIEVMLNLTISTSIARLASAQVPLEAQSETLENSLRKSLPQEFRPDPKVPKITNKTRPTGKTPEKGHTFFLKKIKLTGNSVISDEKLMPLVDLCIGRGRYFTFQLKENDFLSGKRR
jgi:hypothetical protein